MKKAEILALLQALKKCRGNKATFIKHFDDRTCEALYEVVANILHNPRLPEATYKKLRRALHPYKQTLRYLSKPTTKSSRVIKKRKLVQIGGGLSFTNIISAAIPLLASILL